MNETVLGEAKVADMPNMQQAGYPRFYQASRQFGVVGCMLALGFARTCAPVASIQKYKAATSNPQFPANTQARIRRGAGGSFFICTDSGAMTTGAGAV